MKKCKLFHFFGSDYTCRNNCKYYLSVECKLSREKIRDPYKCPFFNPTYGTLVNEIIELDDLISDWNF